jgi:hypothetical protein
MSGRPYQMLSLSEKNPFSRKEEKDKFPRTRSVERIYWKMTSLFAVESYLVATLPPPKAEQMTTILPSFLVLLLSVQVVSQGCRH